jgi:hypothetical protein
MALAGTETMIVAYECTDAEKRSAALHAISRVRRHELPEIMAMLGLKDLPIVDDPNIERCRRGHAWTVLNTRIRPNGRRLCRTCERLRDASRNA